MNSILVLDACTIVNLARIDEDDFLEDKVKALKAYAVAFVLDEVKKRYVPSDKTSKRQIFLVPYWGGLTRIENKDVEELVESVRTVSGYSQRPNGELYSTALSLYLSRMEGEKVLFFTDDFPAKADFNSCFEFQQIGYIGDSVDLLVTLYWLSPKGQFTKDELEKYSDHEEAFRGECLDKLGGKKGKYTADEFRKELRACFRNGEDSKEELDDKDIDVHDMFAWLVGSKNAKKTIDTMFKDNKKAIDETLKELREIEKERVFSSQYYEPRDKVAKDSEAVKLSNYVLDLTYDMRVAIVSANDVKGAITNLSRVVTDPKDIDTFKLIMKRFADAQVTGVEHTNDTHYQKAFNMIKLEIENIIDVDPTSSSYTHRLDFRNTGSDENILITGKDRQKRHALALQLAMKKTHTAKQCLIEIDTAALDAIKERSRQYKACLIKIVHHKGKSESAYTESAYDREPSAYGTDFISSIEFK